MGRLPTGSGIRAVAVNAGLPQQVYAASESGVFRSNDAGETWVPAGTDRDNADIASIALDSSAGNKLFALTKTGQIIISDDGATTWRMVGSAESSPGA